MTYILGYFLFFGKGLREQMPVGEGAACSRFYAPFFQM
jgi:hypothetical protein